MSLSKVEPPQTPETIICPFHNAHLSLRTSSKGWTFLKCEELWCPFWVSADEAAATAKTVPMGADPQIMQGPWMCFCQERSCIRLVSKNQKSPNLGRPYLTCCQTPTCNFFQWVDIPWTKKGEERHDLVRHSQSFGGRSTAAPPPFPSPPALPRPQLLGSVQPSLPPPTLRTPKKNWRVQNTPPTPTTCQPKFPWQQ